MDPPILDRAQTDLLAALPPVITGIGNAWESQETSQTTNAYNNATAVNVGHKSSIITEVSRTREALRSGDRDESNCSSSGGDSMLLMATARTAAEGFSGKKIDVNEVIKPSSALDSGSVNPPDDHTRRMMCTTDNEPSTFVSTTLSSEGDTDNNTEKGYVSDKECVAVTAVRDESVGETPSPVPARTPAELTSSTMMRTGGEVMAVAAETAALPEASVGMSDRKTLGRSRADVSLTRLCRRAVILLTRSPTCPDLVGRQTGVADQRTYDQMEPLLEKAGMSYKDLHPGTMQVPRRTIFCEKEMSFDALATLYIIDGRPVLGAYWDHVSRRPISRCSRNKMCYHQFREIQNGRVAVPSTEKLETTPETKHH